MDTITIIDITILTYVICGLISQTKIKKKMIPYVAGTVGAALGVLCFYLMPGFPANNIISAMSVGAISGLGATGVDQVSKQRKKEE